MQLAENEVRMREHKYNEKNIFKKEQSAASVTITQRAIENIMDEPLFLRCKVENLGVIVKTQKAQRNSRLHH